VNKLKHIYESQQFNQQQLEDIFKVADEIRVHPEKYRKPGKILATIFYEPSTRTRLSFESAMLKLGGSVISTENAKEFSSVYKGESLEDSIKVISNYADVIALRHNEIGAAKRAAMVSAVPVINAGDGAGQHPTQSLLDLYTIRSKFGEIDGKTICLVGDLLYGRTVRSLCYFIGQFYKKVKLIFIAPKICAMGWDIKRYLDEMGVSWKEENDYEKALSVADCVYMTRVQKERFLDMSRFEEATSNFKIDQTTLSILKEDAIVMHPLPRLDEIDQKVDDDPRMIYFEQASNGVWIRMALISTLLN
jgi:aspartate carbamoyltransferase catalytic subunit